MNYFCLFQLSTLLLIPLVPLVLLLCGQFRVKRKSSSSPSPRPKKRKKKKSGRRRSRWVETAFSLMKCFRFFSPFFFSFAFIFCHVDRIITLWFCEVGFQLFWREYCERAVRYWDGGEGVISRSLIFHFLLTRSAKEKETERDRKCALALKRKENEKRKAEAWIEPVTKT